MLLKNRIVHDKVHPLIKCFSHVPSPLAVWLPFSMLLSSPALQINIFLERQCAVNCLDSVCMVTLAAMLLQSAVPLPSWELHRQVHRVWRKKKIDYFRGKK